MIKVYIASPYTLGDVAVNVRKSLDCAHELMNLGFAPFAPLLTHFQHLIHPRPAEDWYQWDNEWVAACDCLLRVPGESKGAEAEIKLAESLGKPVFYSIADLQQHYPNNIVEHAWNPNGK